MPMISFFSRIGLLSWSEQEHLTQIMRDFPELIPVIQESFEKKHRAFQIKDKKALEDLMHEEQEKVINLLRGVK